MDPSRSLFSRQQIGELTGLDDTTLNYWSREGLLVPSEGGKGRGSHRRFDFVQVNIAAILGQMRRFGLSITVMRSFAELLQKAATIGNEQKLHPGNYVTAASLATKLHRFRAGGSVMLPVHHFEEERPNLHGRAYSDWLAAKRPAANEEEIVGYQIRHEDYDPASAIVAVAESLGPGRETEAQIYGELVYEILVPGYSDAYSWLLGFGPGNTWRIEFGAEGGTFFNHLNSLSAEEFGPGIFLPTSGIIRKIWGLKTPAEHRRERAIQRVREQLASAGLAATVTPNSELDEGFSIDAPDELWGDIEALLGKAGFVVERTSDDGHPEAGA